MSGWFLQNVNRKSSFKTGGNCPEETGINTCRHCLWRQILWVRFLNWNTKWIKAIDAKFQRQRGRTIWKINGRPTYTTLFLETSVKVVLNRVLTVVLNCVHILKIKPRIWGNSQVSWFSYVRVCVLNVLIPQRKRLVIHTCYWHLMEFTGFYTQ